MNILASRERQIFHDIKFILKSHKENLYDLFIIPKAFDPLSLSAPIILGLSESELTQQRHLIQQDRMMIVKQADKAD